jgi:hypothetical protein
VTILEDFLRNKIKSLDDVKALKTPPSFYESMHKNQRSAAARQVMEKALDRMREIIDGGMSKDTGRTDMEEYAYLIAEEISSAKDLTEDEQFDIIRQLEI